MGELYPDRQANEGILTTAIGSDGRDTYDYGRRAALIRQTKDDLELGEFEPLPSPWTVEIEPTLGCNADCYFCSYQDDIKRFKELRRQGAGVENGLSQETVFGLLDALEEGGTTKGTYWSGGGDPLVWPHIVPAIKRAAEFSDVFLQTNGISLGKFMKDPDAPDLAAIRLLSVSVYADNPELHAAIAGVGSFGKVTANISRAVGFRDEHGLKTEINAKIMVDANNYRRLPDIVAFYRGLGVDTVGLRAVQDYTYGQTEQSVELTAAQKQELAEIAGASEYQDPSLMSFASAIGRSVLKPAITSRCFNATDGHFACVDAWGGVSIGTPEIGDERFEIGNVNEQPWQEIWKGPRHQEVVREMDRMQGLGICASALCRHVRANVGADRYVRGETGRQDPEIVMGQLGAFM